ncbi:hypothetical protein EI94DRAFT_1817602 [Lactarius quietus]|nr:hypothetical protein EI94DRAFT_1817602 [Lactarius quietus]
MLPPWCWLVCASDLTQRHGLSDKLKDFLQRAWALELSTGSHVALVKTVIDEMLLEHDSIFAKLQADLHQVLLSRLIVFNWSHYSKQAILEALTLIGDAITAHSHCLVMHGESIHHDLLGLESIALEISCLLVAKDAAVKWKREEINSKVLTFFGRNRGTLHTLAGWDADLNRINHIWREARESLSLGIHAFNGIQSDLTALSEHQASPKPTCLHIPVDKQDNNLKGWNFLDVEAIVGAEDEEELDDEEEDFCEFLNDDELVLDDETETALRTCCSSIEAQNLEDEQLGQENNVVFQICHRCLEPSEIHPPAITSAFAQPSILGYVFIEAFDIEAAVHAVKGFVTVHDKQL